MTPKPDPNDLLTVGRLHALLTDAIKRGLDPHTAVVVGPPDHDWLQVSQTVGDPSDSPDREWLWFTLFTAAPADPRRTPEHSWDPDVYGECGECDRTFRHQDMVQVTVPARHHPSGQVWGGEMCRPCAAMVADGTPGVEVVP